jgi:hypothetical protein
VVRVAFEVGDGAFDVPDHLPGPLDSALVGAPDLHIDAGRLRHLDEVVE